MIHDDSRHVAGLEVAEFHLLDAELADRAEQAEGRLLDILEQAALFGDLVVQECHRRAGVKDHAVGPFAVDLDRHHDVLGDEQLERHRDGLDFRHVGASRRREQ